MDIPTIPGALYTVATKTTCDITDTATGTPIDSASSGSVTFAAQGAVTTLSDSDATYTRVNFKNAAAALRMLGGGDQLPSGYFAAEFLESTGKEYIDTDIVWKSSDVLRLDYGAISDTPNYNIFGVNNNYRFLNTSVVQMAIKGSAYNFATVLTKGKHYILFDTTYRYVFDGEEKEGYHATWTAGNLTLFSISTHVYNAVIRFYKFTHENEAKVKLLPTISPQGEPCLVDTVSKKAYKNNGTGAFVVGLTLAQARQLGKLPAGGGTLKISLPENYTDDEAVVAALSTATENGWVFEIQTYTADGAESSTFALRRIWVKKTADPAGSYVDATGERWHVEWCQTVLGTEPFDLGYEPCRAVDVALAEWELTPYIYPEEELSSI